MEPVTFTPANPLLYDRLHTLAAEYSVTTELLINLAIRRLLDDVELIRSLRSGEMTEEKAGYSSSASK